jgi:hypothetical protein
VAAVWCDLRGLAKDHQRGLIQPFLAAMQCVALALLIAGTVLGIVLFGRVDQTAFRWVMLAILFAGGMALVVCE